MKRILIIEDAPGDFRYYRPLMSDERDVGILFVMDAPGFDDEKARDYLILTYEKSAKLLRDVTVCAPREAEAVLGSSSADYYIFDSLEGAAIGIAEKAKIPKEKIAILSNTSSFVREAKQNGYHAYQKMNIESLIENLGL